MFLEFKRKGRVQFCVVQDDIVEHQALQVFASFMYWEVLFGYWTLLSHLSLSSPLKLHETSCIALSFANGPYQLLVVVSEVWICNCHKSSFCWGWLNSWTFKKMATTYIHIKELMGSRLSFWVLVKLHICNSSSFKETRTPRFH